MEWLDPPFTAGHRVAQLVRLAGAHDVLAREGFPSAQIRGARLLTPIPRLSC